LKPGRFQRPVKNAANQLQGPFAQVIPLPIIKAGFAVKINCDEKRTGLCFYRTRTYLLLSINGSRHPAESVFRG